jgi:hypothetical protein
MTTYHLADISKINKVPFIGEKYKEKFPLPKRMFLETPYLSDQAKLNTIRYVLRDTDAAETLEKGVKMYDESLKLTDKLSNKFKPTDESLEQYKIYKENYGGKRKRKTRRNKFRTKAKKTLRKRRRS